MEGQDHQDQQTETTTVEKLNTEELNEEDMPSTAQTQLIQQLTESLNKSMDEKIQQLITQIGKKRPSDDDDRSNPPDDDVLSLFARDSFIKDVTSPEAGEV